MPFFDDWAAFRAHWTYPWVEAAVIVGACVAAAVILNSVIFRLARRLARSRDVYWAKVLKRGKTKVRIALIIVALGVGATLSPLPDDNAAIVRAVLRFLFVLNLGWIAVGALDVAARLHLRRFDVTVEDNLVARKHVTQVRILQRAAAVLVFAVTAGLALTTLPGVRQWGVSLLASAGAAGLIMGLALQPILTNLIAGVQIALTQPIRIDDAVIVEGEFGRVEEIGSTYVVVRLWDLRRMVLPLTWFTQNPFQNWTRETASILGTVLLYLDHRAPVAAIRTKLEEIVHASPAWDGEVAVVQVTDMTERSIEVRCLISATNAGKAFDLRCEVREKMIDWLQTHHPYALPRERVDLGGASAATAGGL